MRLETQIDTVVLAVLIAGLLPFICAIVAKWGGRGYDNHNPREWLAHQDGYRARANAAQQNSFEAFPFFAVGVVLAALGGADGDAMEIASWVFVAARVAYIVCYVKDLATSRSLMWLVGWVATIYLYVQALS
jgi:uncharacterized MAPEG superfamily protein